MNIEEALGIKLSVLVAGLVGGIISLTYERRITLGRALILIFTGATTAAYLHPVAQHYIGFTNEFSSAVGFVTGLISMKVIGYIFDKSELYLKEKFPIPNVNSDKDSSNS